MHDFGRGPVFVIHLPFGKSFPDLPSLVRFALLVNLHLLGFGSSVCPAATAAAVRFFQLCARNNAADRIQKSSITFVLWAL